MTVVRTPASRSVVAVCCLAVSLALLFLAGGPVAGSQGLEPERASGTVVRDRAPGVSITGAPRIESYHEYHYFGFSSDVPGSSFFCSLDEEPFAPCASGAYRYVPYGQHTFGVYAVSPGGTRGETAVVEYESRDPNWD